MTFIEFLTEYDDIGTRTQGPSGSTTTFPNALPSGTFDEVNMQVKKSKERNEPSKRTPKRRKRRTNQ